MGSIAVGDPGKEMVRDKKGAVFGYRFDSLACSWIPVGRIQMDYPCDWYSYSVRLMDNEDLLVVCRDGEYFSGFSTVYHHEKPEMGDHSLFISLNRRQMSGKRLQRSMNSFLAHDLEELWHYLEISPWLPRRGMCTR